MAEQTTPNQVTEMTIRKFGGSFRDDMGKGDARLNMEKQYKGSMSIQPHSADSYSQAQRTPK